MSLEIIVTYSVYSIFETVLGRQHSVEVSKNVRELLFLRNHLSCLAQNVDVSFFVLYNLGKYNITRKKLDIRVFVQFDPFHVSLTQQR